MKMFFVGTTSSSVYLGTENMIIAFMGNVYRNRSPNCIEKFRWPPIIGERPLKKKTKNIKQISTES